MSAPDRPTTDSDSETWWAAVQNGTLLVTTCASCGRNSLYPRPFCPYCWSEEVSSIPASGRATLYTWTVVHQGSATSLVAMVDLAEGPRLMTKIEHCSPDVLEAGLPLQLDFRHDDDGFAVPVFKPLTAALERK
ncbi:Zn-ribbon domain-containing OB-fold protein [Mycolicibacterium setense]|uniref:Zn-ribbon domain-containing OB-fold protein n=1 Tax=Mycolicibacterium setense TaxID=431269 RepID=UPI0005752BF1|nr:OB-fold domain-containing protein [Mycolicibacterium setense]KHO21223.1 DNA-binding protein [Mycolicibacterium setense]MCV7114756.1 OB-fold domain-containing protein [Mycolicibacterium setense]